MSSQAPQKLLEQEPLGLPRSSRASASGTCGQGANRGLIRERQSKQQQHPHTGKCWSWGAGAHGVSGPELSPECHMGIRSGKPRTPC